MSYDHRYLRAHPDLPAAVDAAGEWASITGEPCYAIAHLQGHGGRLYVSSNLPDGSGLPVIELHKIRPPKPTKLEGMAAAP